MSFVSCDDTVIPPVDATRINFLLLRLLLENSSLVTFGICEILAELSTRRADEVDRFSGGLSRNLRPDSGPEFVRIRSAALPGNGA